MMGTYFKPLRRKIGVVTLVLACLFAAGWIRGYVIKDHFMRRTGVDIRTKDVSFTAVHLTSSKAGLSWWWLEGKGSGGFRKEWQWRAERISKHTGLCDLDFFSKYERTHWEFGGVHIVEGMTIDRAKATVWIVEYWSIVIPLTLLSAWLLLSKPRPKITWADERDAKPTT